MEPRRQRLGGGGDDYCSRCRLLSNHAIAAIVDDVIKQTRCSTCDFEHPYKDGKLPVRRTKKDGTSALYQQVLDNVAHALKAAGSSIAGLTQVRVYVTDIEAWPAFNTLYAAWAGAARPARAVVLVPKLHYGFKIEVEAVAVKTEP